MRQCYLNAIIMILKCASMKIQWINDFYDFIHCVKLMEHVRIIVGGTVDIFIWLISYRAIVSMLQYLITRVCITMRKNSSDHFFVYHQIISVEFYLSMESGFFILRHILFQSSNDGFGLDFPYVSIRFFLFFYWTISIGKYHDGRFIFLLSQKL